MLTSLLFLPALVNSAGEIRMQSCLLHLRLPEVVADNLAVAIILKDFELQVELLDCGNCRLHFLVVAPANPELTLFAVGAFTFPGVFSILLAYYLG